MAKLSRREAWAARTGRSKYEYKDSAEGRADKKIEEYYDKRLKFEDEAADLKQERLEKDFKRIMKEFGYAKEELLEDYTRNIKRLEENKATDLEDLNYYLDTTRTRTQEDTDTSLQRELRNFQLNMERTQESLAARNLAFSGLSGVRGREEGLVEEGYQQNVEDITRASQRSFQDLDRLETVKNLAIETQFGRDIEDTETAKERGLRNIKLGTEKAKTQYDLGARELDIAEERQEFETGAAKDTDRALLAAQFAPQYLRERYE
jgi:hypothetical protein